VSVVADGFDKGDKKGALWQPLDHHLTFGFNLLIIKTYA
jgi:hypothetical protein